MSAHGTPRRPAAPRLLDPILAAWERLDRRRRHIRPAREGAVLGLELRRHRGAPVVLPDGARVARGALIGELHVDNARIRNLGPDGAWARGLAAARLDLAAIASWSGVRHPEARPVAYHGGGLLSPFGARVGFTVRRRPRTPLARLDEWYARWLLGHWSPVGRRRLAQGRGRLSAADAWISDAALRARFGARID